jgi:hypothetical protein
MLRGVDTMKEKEKIFMDHIDLIVGLDGSHGYLVKLDDYIKLEDKIKAFEKDTIKDCELNKKQNKELNKSFTQALTMSDIIAENLLLKTEVDRLTPENKAMIEENRKDR